MQAADDRWLSEDAWRAQANHRAWVVCATDDDHIIGFYALAAGSLLRGAPARGAPHPIPVVILSHLAVDHARGGPDTASDLLIDAMSRSLRAATTLGARALVAYAGDVTAASFYRRHDFAPLASRAHHLYLLFSDIAASFDAATREVHPAPRR